MRRDLIAGVRSSPATRATCTSLHFVRVSYASNRVGEHDMRARLVHGCGGFAKIGCSRVSNSHGPAAYVPFR